MRGAVLAGGHATRFAGRPKGLETVGGARILDRVVDAVTAATGAPPLLIANDQAAPGWRSDLEVHPDIIPDCGSLGGLHTALSLAADTVLVVAWDMPFVTPELLTALVQGSRSYDTYLPESVGPLGVEPLCGVYGPACAAPIRRHIDDRDYRTTSFHSDVHAGTLPLERVRDFGNPEVLFFNVNAPEDLERAHVLLRGEHAVSG